MDSSFSLYPHPHACVHLNIPPKTHSFSVSSCPSSTPTLHFSSSFFSPLKTPEENVYQDSNRRCSKPQPHFEPSAKAPKSQQMESLGCGYGSMRLSCGAPASPMHLAFCVKVPPSTLPLSSLPFEATLPSPPAIGTRWQQHCRRRTPRGKLSPRRPGSTEEASSDADTRLRLLAPLPGADTRPQLLAPLPDADVGTQRRTLHGWRKSRRRDEKLVAWTNSEDLRQCLSRLHFLRRRLQR